MTVSSGGDLTGRDSTDLRLLLLLLLDSATIGTAAADGVGATEVSLFR